MMQEKILKDLKKGEFLKRKADAKEVYIKGDYDRATKSFCCVAYSDINKWVFIKANKKVFVGFTF
ncbi:MAG: hypothetical protein J6V44_01665 [Methanobrevibacter sp.]|nr:hypothetical protein [Methanobrevibacter sp.]